jgi:hypothetical protein
MAKVEEKEVRFFQVPKNCIKASRNKVIFVGIDNAVAGIIFYLPERR